MATVAVNFEHMGETFAKGDEVPDDLVLVRIAPHLFIQPDPEPEPTPRNVRIRGPLVDPPKSKKERA
jgi:hypothetical protein